MHTATVCWKTTNLFNAQKQLEENEMKPLLRAELQLIALPVELIIFEMRNPFSTTTGTFLRSNNCKFLSLSEVVSVNSDVDVLFGVLGSLEMVAGQTLRSYCPVRKTFSAFPFIDQ